MAEILKQFFVIKATSKVTGNIHYVEINNDEVSLVKRNSDATIFNTVKDAKKAITDYCAGEITHNYTVDSIMLSLEEAMTKGE